ncbi:MAG TPA: GNAT family N-acetyltransferase [Candidatus Nanoarchaeia archaeon]|nr:GNAT family N-acetyltransferase [Candidatus Nanoarchaeia archaeon]
MNRVILKSKIRMPLAEDFDDIFLLLQQLWLDEELEKEEQRESFLEDMESKNRCFLVAEHESRVIGYASVTIRPTFWQDGNSCHIDEMVTDSRFRGKGIGTALLDGITTLAKEKGCTRLELESSFFRKDAHGFYVSKGFEKQMMCFSKNI